MQVTAPHPASLLTALRPWFSLGFLLLVVGHLLFQPLVRSLSRGPLLRHLGLTYGDLTLSGWRLKLVLTDLELRPSRSRLLRAVLLAIFPSAHVQRSDDDGEHPESTISVGRLSIKIRVSALAAHERARDEGQRRGDAAARAGGAWRRLLPRPTLVIKLRDVAIAVEKAYLAPEPPAHCRAPAPGDPRKWPAALAPANESDNRLPTFDQGPLFRAIRGEELDDAECVTNAVERWIDHAVTKTKNDEDGPSGAVEPSSLSRKLTSYSRFFSKGPKREGSEGDLAAGDAAAAGRHTHDEKVNAWIGWGAELVLHSLLFELRQVAVTIAGVDAATLTAARKAHSPQQANLLCARLPRRRRAVTAVGAEIISLSFSPDAHCNALLCFVGLHAKVGKPVVADPPKGGAATPPLSADVEYAWHMLVHPHNLAAEVQGILPIITWAANYDYHWQAKTLELTLSTTEVAFSLSPEHLHTVLLHLDDYMDPMSPFNEWLEWLKNRHRQTLETSAEEREVYRHNYARIKGASTEEGDGPDSGKRLTLSQMRDIERRLTRYEIMSLRCFAMEGVWKVPEVNQDLDQFLLRSRSSICALGDEGCATAAEALTPFQRRYPTPLHALVSLIRETASLLAPHVTVHCLAHTLHIDTPGASAASFVPSIPSSITVSGVSFDIVQHNVLSVDAEAPGALDGPRPFLDLSLRISGCKWDVVDDTASAVNHELPQFRGHPWVGIVYVSEEAVPSSKPVLSLGLTIAITPTTEPEQHFGLTFSTVNLVIVLNPLPILSALQNLIELSGLPSQSPDVTSLDPTDMPSDASVPSFGVPANIVVSVENTQLLFLVDRKKVQRGTLSLIVCGMNLEVDTGGLSGRLSFSTEPVMLCAGLITHEQKFQPMPFQPIADVAGAKLLVTGKEEQNPTKGTPKAANPETTTTSLRLNVEFGTESFCFNASPSTIVGLFGVASSLDPFLDWVQGEHTSNEEGLAKLEAERKEAKQYMDSQRSHLRRLFSEIDVDSSGQISEVELETLVLKLFDKNTSMHRTTKELVRERDYLLAMLDKNQTSEITFQELDSLLFRLTNEIDDVNLIPRIKDVDRPYNDYFGDQDSFLSGSMMNKLVYYEDLREFAGTSEVYRITGQVGPENSSNFPAPAAWPKGEGIQTFWDLFSEGTGCTRHSFNGQDMASVQRKLVRTLCNYEFAKFCWKSLVQLELYNEERAETHWLLDEDPRPEVQCGVIDMLLRHVETQVTKDMNQQRIATDVQYDVSVVAVVGSCILKFGSSHKFARPLFEARASKAKVNASGLLSSSSTTASFVLDKVENVANLDNNKTANRILFQSSISAYYLNTKHNHMECFIEPYPCFGTATYTVFQEVAIGYSIGDDIEATSFTINLNCPRFLNINTSRSFFETASVLMKVLSQSDPEKFRKTLHDRDVSSLCKYWDLKDRRKSGVLSRDQAMEVLRLATTAYWKDERAGRNENEKNHFLNTLCDLADEKGDGIILFDNVIVALKTYSSRCYFSGSEEILLTNNIGRKLKVSTKGDLEEHCMRHSIASEYDYQQLLDHFLSIDAGDSGAIPMNGQLALFTPGYGIVDDLSVSPYQSLMFLLKHQKKGSRRRRRHASASGFKPYLTVVPKPDSLDSITLQVRSCVHVCSDIPIKIRIVRLGKSVRKFSKHDPKSKIALNKKSLMAALRNAIEGSPIIYEDSDIKEGAVALPLDVLDSSHYHALLIQPLTGSCSWRDPVLLTKEFLYNPMNIQHVSRCHALSGVIVRKERLNVHLPKKHRIAGGKKLRTTAWDTTIQVVPFFLLTNSLPFPLLVRTWQTAGEDEDELWDQPLLLAQTDDMSENSSSDEDLSFVTPSIRIMGKTRTDGIHFSSGGNSHLFSQDYVATGSTLRLSGVSLKETLFMQVSQYVNASEVTFMWADPVKVELSKMRTGVNRKGLVQLPKLVLNLGDTCDCLLHVSIGGGTRVPEGVIYSPYWLMNKTGAKLEYRISGQKTYYLDSGSGGLPVMTHSFSESNEISVLPLECPRQDVANMWWDEASNGVLVVSTQGVMEEDGKNLVHWSKNIDLDAAGTSGELNCGEIIVNAQIKPLAGAFHQSNLICFTPRYVVKNILHIAISLLPLSGCLRDVIRKASQLRNQVQHSKRKIDLAPGQTAILFNFHNISHGAEKTYRWIAFCVHASRFGATFKNKWHLLPVDVIDSHYFGEHDGNSDTMCGILEAKVHSSDTGSMVASISHANVPPFRVENRSSHHLRFVQDDKQAVVFELPPMHSCAYTWDSPLGRKKLRAVVIPRAQSKKYLLDKALKLERKKETLQDKAKDKGDYKETEDSTDSDSDFIKGEATEEPLIHFLSKSNGLQSDSGAREFNKTFRHRSHRKRAVFGNDSRSFILSTLGKKQQLPCPTAEESDSGLLGMASKLFTHTRVVVGTKILSFSDSAWLSDQVQTGIMRKGGNFKSACCEMNVEGFGLYIMDDFPREVMAVVVRDIQLLKPTGSIEMTARVRHFQVDAMLPNARYPIIFQPLPLGVDRRDPLIKDSYSSDLIVPSNVDKKDCFWMKNEEKPLPVLEIACSYVPHVNMTWLPSVDIVLSSLKLQIDVDYILGVLGMIVNSIFKFQNDVARKHTVTSHANAPLQYTTRGQLNICTTLIEKLRIAPFRVEMELNIKSDDSDHDDDKKSRLTLQSLARKTNSAAAAGFLSWVIKAGASAAHLSPRFEYSHETYTDQQPGDIFDLLYEIAWSYGRKTILQAHKIVFSTQLLGDVSHLLHQYKTGVVDQFKPYNEITATEKAVSLVENFVGETCFWFGKFSGGWADTLDTIISNDATSNHLKPKSAASSDGNHPKNAVDGFVEGTKFGVQNVVHGIAGLVGDPYRGIKSGNIKLAAKGIVSGVVGVPLAPVVGALGFCAKFSDGLGATTKHLALGVIESRCRPARIVPWGKPMSNNGLSFLKAIGIRIHTVRYQKMRKRLVKKHDNDETGEDDDDDDDEKMTSKEYKRFRTAEERRKNPPRKLVSIMHEKDSYHYITAPIRPKLLSDAPGNLVLSHYAVTFEETLILHSSDLQLDDIVAINIWNYRGLKSATIKQSPLGVCKLLVGDIYSSVLHLYNEELNRKECNLVAETAAADSLIIPVPQEYALFKSCKKRERDHKDIFEVIGEEMEAIEKIEDDAFDLLDSDSSGSDSDDISFLGHAKKTKDEDLASSVKANERLFGSVSLSFFPIPW